MASRKNGIFDGVGSTQATIIRYLRRKNAASRAEIAELCGITAAAVSMMTRDLLDRGLIVEGARRQVGRGAPHIDLTLNASVGYAFGIHTNKYSVTLTLLDFGGRRIGELQLRGDYDTFAEVAQALQAGTASLLESGSIGKSALLGAGMAMPTRFRKKAVPLDLAEEVISWAGADLSAPLRQALGCPVMIENDANAAAMGELSLGNSAGHENFAYLYLSEGIGSGLIINNELYRGNIGNAGEIGALRSRRVSRPSFEDLANWCATRRDDTPLARDPQEWTRYLAAHPDILDAWLERAGPETARLAFSVSAILAPSGIYLGGTLPQMVRERLLVWLDFARSRPFQGELAEQPQTLLPDVVTTDAAAFGAAAMILHSATELHRSEIG